MSIRIESGEIELCVKATVFANDFKYPVKVRVNKSFEIAVEGKVDNLISRTMMVESIFKVPLVKKVDFEKLKIVDIENRLATYKNIQKLIDSYNSLFDKKVKAVVMNGHVTLKGQVNKLREKHIISRVISKVSGIKKISNEIDVSRKKKSITRLPGLETQIKQQFESVLQLKIFKKGKKAEISGRVLMPETRKLVENYIYQKTNVDNIFNNLDVVSLS